MINKGDIVICKADTLHAPNGRKVQLPVTIGKRYQVLGTHLNSRNELMIRFTNDKGITSNYLAKRFTKLTEDEMQKGTKVKCEMWAPDLTTGKIYEVLNTKVHNNKITSIEIVDNSGSKWWREPSNFSIVKENEETYLQQEIDALLIVANKGREALLKAYKLSGGKVTYRSIHTTDMPMPFKTAPPETIYELSKLPTLTPFTVNKWDVKLNPKDAECVNIGCQIFVINQLVKCLHDMLFNCHPAKEVFVKEHPHITTHKSLQATRNGLVFEGNHHISFQDAETLYNNIKHLLN